MDYYQGSLQHEAILAQNMPTGDPCLYDREIDHIGSWVMLKRTGEIEPLDNERILLQSPRRVSLELTVPQRLRTANPTFSIKCDDGTAYITTTRVIYLAAKPTEAFKSFSAFTLDVADARPTASGWLGMGAWSWVAEATPRAGGGIPSDVPRVKLVLTFNDGGMDSFHSKYRTMYERLLQARDVARETGQRLSVHDDDLPAYSASEPVAVADGMSGSGGAAPTVAAPGAAQVQPVIVLHPSHTPLFTGASQAVLQQPNEPPPGYDEAQAQAVEIQLDERERREAERDQ